MILRLARPVSFRLRIAGAVSSLGLAVAPLAMASTQSVFVSVAPCRIVDTRGPAGAFGAPSLSVGSPRSFALASGPCGGIPPGVDAYALNVTATNTRGAGFFKIYPEGGVSPIVSTLNYNADQTVANAAIVTAGSGGGVTFAAGVSGADLIVDITGYFVAGSSALTLPYASSGSDPTATFSVTNTGTGVGVLAQSTGGGIAGAALTAHGAGIGAVITNTSSDTALLLGNNVSGGTGNLLKAFVPAGEFHIDGQGNLVSPGGLTSRSVTVSSSGSGPAIQSTASLFGVSGHATGSAGSGVIGIGDGSSQGVAGNSANADGVHGLSTTANGVEGDSRGNGASGVYGQNDNGGGYGVFGRNTAGGFGMGTDGPAFQSRSQGGWVKAMAYVDPGAGSPIVRCFSSQQAGTAAGSPPCGFTYAKEGTGSYFFDFGFAISDRFILAQPMFGSGGTFFAPTVTTVGSTGVQITFLLETQTSISAQDTPFFIFIF